MIRPRPRGHGELLKLLRYGKSWRPVGGTREDWACNLNLNNLNNASGPRAGPLGILATNFSVV